MRISLVLTILLSMIVVACDRLPQAASPTATRAFSAPTIVPSPTIILRNSDQLYGTIHDGQSMPDIASLPVNAAVPPLTTSLEEDGAQTVQMTLTSGETINALLYPHPNEGRSTGILLIGSAGQLWANLPSALAAAGYNALLIELPDNSPVDWVNTLLEAYREDTHVDPARMLIIGAEAHSDLALAACVSDLICDGVILFSPQNRQTMLGFAPELAERPMLLVANRNETASQQLSTALVAQAPDSISLIETEIGNGTNMIALNSDLNSRIIAWLTTVWQ